MTISKKIFFTEKYEELWAGNLIPSHIAKAISQRHLGIQTIRIE